MIKLLFLILILYICSTKRIGKVVPVRIQEKYNNKKRGYKELKSSLLPIFGKYKSVKLEHLGHKYNVSDFKISFSFENFKFTTPFENIYKNEDISNILVHLDFIFEYNNDDILKVKTEPRYVFHEEKDMDPRTFIHIHYHWKRMYVNEHDSTQAMTIIFGVSIFFVFIIVTGITFSNIFYPDRKEMWKFLQTRNIEKTREKKSLYE